MIEPSNRAIATTARGGDRLQQMVARIAIGDRAAFRCLYAFRAMRVWQDAIRALPHPADARAVTRSTFVEVWHLAGHHLDGARLDTRDWIAEITARRAEDRLRGTPTSCTLRDCHDRHTHRELATLLGAGSATILTATAAYARVDDLDVGNLCVAGGVTT